MGDSGSTGVVGQGCEEKRYEILVHGVFDPQQPAYDLAMPPFSRFKYALYRLQVRWGLSQTETKTITLVLSLLLAGLVFKHFRSQYVLFDPGDYAHLDASYAAASRAFRADSLSQLEAGFGPVNVNIASSIELQRLPRIGPAMAARIVDHRSKRGPFATLESLMDVPGIGPKTLEQLKPLVVLAADTSTAQPQKP